MGLMGLTMGLMGLMGLTMGLMDLTANATNKHTNHNLFLKRSLAVLSVGLLAGSVVSAIVAAFGVLGSTGTVESLPTAFWCS